MKIQPDSVTDEWLVSIGGKQSTFSGVMFWNDRKKLDAALVVTFHDDRASVAIVLHDNEQLHWQIPGSHTKSDVVNLLKALRMPQVSWVEADVPLPPEPQTVERR